MFPFFKHAVKNLFSKPSTVKYPYVPVEVKPGYRGRIEYNPDKCFNCGMCIKVCSPGAITRETEIVGKEEKITFMFDLTSCTFCGTCQDFCHSNAIELTDDFHMASEKKEDLIVTGYRYRAVDTQLVCYEGCVYCGLCAKNCPENALIVDRENKTWKVEEDECVDCGTCVTVCPKKVLALIPKKKGK